MLLIFSLTGAVESILVLDRDVDLKSGLTFAVNPFLVFSTRSTFLIIWAEVVFVVDSIRVVVSFVLLDLRPAGVLNARDFGLITT
jgi:hypothetical protein